MGNSLKEKLLNLDEENLCNYITELEKKLSLAKECLPYVQKDVQKATITSNERKEF